MLCEINQHASKLKANKGLTVMNLLVGFQFLRRGEASATPSMFTTERLCPRGAMRSGKVRPKLVML